jgi:hypothetical protein
MRARVNRARRRKRFIYGIAFTPIRHIRTNKEPTKN